MRRNATYELNYSTGGGTPYLPPPPPSMNADMSFALATLIQAIIICLS